MGEKNDMIVIMATLFVMGVVCKVKFLGQPQALGQETWPPNNIQSLGVCFVLWVWFGVGCGGGGFVLPTVASNNHQSKISAQYKVICGNG